jgi:hypothetical protein
MLRLGGAHRRFGFTLPQGSSALPMLRFIDRKVPYDHIQAIETRCELFENVMVPVLLRATCLLTRLGEHVRFGMVNERCHFQKSAARLPNAPV